MPLDAAFTQLPDHTVQATLNGTMTLGTSLKMFESQLRSEISNGARRVILDMESLTYMDSAGLGVLVLMNAELANQGGTLILRAVNERVRELLHLTRTDAILNLES